MENESPVVQTDEWELSKENVQPLKSGRKVAKLSASLQLQTQPNSVNHRQQIILQRQALESELRSYSGDDPIAPWDHYIHWTEQTFPRGGKESNMRLLLERCVQQFKDEPCYKNDLRYVNAWLKLAGNFSNDPLEMYQFMRDQGIGFQSAAFYEAWAGQLEQLGNTKKAESVYQEGMNCKAEPVGRLEALHREFQFRVARTTMTNLQEAQYNSHLTSTGPERTVLGGLKGKGKQQKVGTQRTGAAVKKGSSGGLGLQVAPAQVGQQYTIFCDDAPAQSSLGGAAAAAALPAPTGEWENMPPSDQARKENEQSAGPWAGQKIRQQRSTAIALDEVSTYAKQNFTVHVDDDSQPITTPRKLPEMGNQVLSVHKPEKRPENTLKDIQKPWFNSNNDGKAKVMYCKHLIYGGTAEMSFEEIRAIKVNKKKEELRLATEREALHKQQQSLQEQQLLMLQKQEEFERKVQERLEQQQIQHEEVLKRFRAQQQMMEQEMLKVHSQAEKLPQPPAGMASIEPNIVDQENQSMKIGAALRQPMVQENISDNNRFDNIPQVKLQGLDNQPPVLQQQCCSASAPTPEESHRRTVGMAQQQLQDLQQHQLNDPVNGLRFPNPKPGNADDNQHDDRSQQNLIEGDATGNLSCTQQLQFDDVTRTGNWQQLIPITNQPTPLLSKPPHAMNLGKSITPNTSGIFNSSQQKTPLDKSLLPDSRASSHSGRISRITPIHTPGGIAAPSPTVNTKEALGTIMAMLNNPLAMDEGWRPTTAGDTNTYASITDEHKFTFESEFARGDAKPATKCAFAIATDDEYANQENHPPKDYVAPQPDPRPRTGILQPSVGIPVMRQEEQAVHVDRQNEDDADIMEGIEPIEQVENDDHPSNATHHHESTIMHHSTHSAFEVAAHMASTPFNPQFGSEWPSFSLMSSIKPSINDSLQRPENSALPVVTNHRTVPFTIAADPIPTSVAIPSGCAPGEVKDVPLKSANNTATATASRVELTGLESFDDESTVNPPCKVLSPIMEENSAEAHQSSASSNGSHSQSQAASLAASHIQHQYAVTSDSPRTADSSRQANNSHRTIGSSEDISSSQLMSSFVNVQKSSSSSKGSVSGSNVGKFDLESKFQNISLCQEMNMGETSLNRPADQSLLNQSGRPVEQMSHTSAVNEVHEDVSKVFDPWDEGFRQSVLASALPPFATYPGYAVIDSDLPNIEPGLAVSVGNEIYNIVEKIGEGNFAKIYSARLLHMDDFELEDGDDEVAVKVEKPACAWEFYISRQAHMRVKELGGIDVNKSLMDVENAYLFDDGSCLIMELHCEGTLLNMVNLFGHNGMTEDIALYFAIELMYVIEKLHACQIIHGDIKPDNILVRNMIDNWHSLESATALMQPGYTNYIQLIDMGRGIDMTQFPVGTVFTSSCGTPSFECIEMQTGRPWTYQTDLYGLAGTLHCMLFGVYMKPFQEGGRWKITGSPKRWFKADWKGLFDALLNIPSCDELPSLAVLRQGLVDTLKKHHISNLVNSMSRLAIKL